jgi:bifunctional ADP-heptose synthase (sugar kinase/adenylyltransferase)
VQAAGGIVRTLGFVPGYSTTEVIRKIKGDRTAPENLQAGQP